MKIEDGREEEYCAKLGCDDEELRRKIADCTVDRCLEGLQKRLGPKCPR